MKQIRTTKNGYDIKIDIHEGRQDLPVKVEYTISKRGIEIDRGDARDEKAAWARIYSIMKQFKNSKEDGMKTINAITPEHQEAIKNITKEIDDLNKSIEGQTDTAKRIQLISRRNNLETQRRNIKANNTAFTNEKMTRVKVKNDATPEVNELPKTAKEGTQVKCKGDYYLKTKHGWMGSKYPHKSTNSFTNGQQRAQQAIANKLNK